MNIVRAIKTVIKSRQFYIDMSRNAFNDYQNKFNWTSAGSKLMTLLNEVVNSMEDRTPQQPPVIHPLSIEAVRPLWSVMIPAYNCIEYLPSALYAVLAQDSGSELMQIEVIDDCSTDGDVEALVEKIGEGRVKYFKQDKKQG